MLTGAERVTLFLGNFGSGKTEVAVNFAAHLASQRLKEAVSLADLDLVNPYFRSREPREFLEQLGVQVVVPEGEYTHADLPILLPGVRSMLMASTAYVILDVGGDDVGARVLGALNDALPDGSYRALMVLNANRPFTEDVPGAERICREIEAAGKIRITGLVSNTHLMEDTTVETVLKGVNLSRTLGSKMGIPLEFVCCPAVKVKAVSARVPEEILPISRRMTPPWKAPEGGRLGKDLFRLS